MAEIAVQRGLFFEDFAVGDTVSTDARTITEADIVNFASLSGDWNAIHVDAEYARQTQFGERIAHGLLGLSVATGLAVQMGFITGTVIAFMGVDWKFRAPIKVGDTIHAYVEIAEKRAMPRLGGGIVGFNVQILNQRDEVTQKGTWHMLVKAKPAP